MSAPPDRSGYLARVDLGDLTDLFDDNEGLGAVRDAADWVLEHRDELSDLAQNLPKLLDRVGDTLRAAGGGVTEAAHLLTGEEGAGVAELASSAASAVTSSTKELGAITKVLGDIGEKLDAVPLIDDVASTISDGVERVEAIMAQLDEVATQLKGLGRQLGATGKGLGVAGTNLTKGGATLNGFAAGGGARGAKRGRVIPRAMPALSPPYTRRFLTASSFPRGLRAGRYPALTGVSSLLCSGISS